jgi:FkbM family methyltransferase
MYAVRRRLPASLRDRIFRLGVFLGGYDAEILRDELSRGQREDASLPSVTGTLRYLRDWGFQPRTAVDVGAFCGDWTRLAKDVFPSCQIVMVEPQERRWLNLRDVCSECQDVSCEAVLLGASDGARVEFNEMSTGSSVFAEASPVSRTTVTKQTTTLDALVRARGWTGVDLLKLDVQGYELEVLKGAAQCLPTCEFVLLECSLIPINRGCPLIADVLAFMRERGFRLLDICAEHRRKDAALWQTDLMFINERSRYMPVPELTTSNW